MNNTLERAVEVGPTGVPAPLKFSPTQISKFKACRRKYHFEYALGIKPPSSKSQLVGKQIHRDTEVPLRKGEVPTDPRAYAAVVELAKIDAAGENTLEARLRIAAADPKIYAQTIAIAVEDGTVGIEKEIEIALTPSPVDGQKRIFTGVIDLYDGRKTRAEITDHKTSSDVKYAKTSYELAEDVQMLSYAHWALLQPDHMWGPSDTVLVRHLFIPTRGRARAMPTEIELTREHVESRWAGFLPIIDEMDLVRRVKASADVPADGYTNGECERFGGCPHRARCASAIFGAGETITMSSEVQDRIAKLRAKVGGTPPPATAPAAQPSPPQQLYAQPAAPAAAPVAAPAGGGAGLAKLKALQAARAGGAAPVAPAAPAPVAQAPAAIDVNAKIAELRGLGKPQVVQAPELAEDHPLQSQAFDHVPQQAPRKDADSFTRLHAGSRIAVLYLDCAPTHGIQAERLEVVLAPMLELIKASTSMGWQHHEYRRGPALVADGIATLALPAHLIVDTSTALGKVALEALVPRADVIVSGRAA